MNAGNRDTAPRASTSLLRLLLVLVCIVPCAAWTMGQGMSATQFFLYGKKHFTQTGYVNHVAKYAKEEAPNLTGKVFVVTGP